MTFDEVLGQIQELRAREQRVSYRGLKRRFDLDDEYLFWSGGEEKQRGKQRKGETTKALSISLTSIVRRCPDWSTNTPPTNPTDFHSATFLLSSLRNL